MNEALMQLITQTGIWCVTAYILGKAFFDYINKKDEVTRQDTKQREERIYTIMEKLENTISQQKDILVQQVLTTEHNKQVLDKLTDIQMLHTNRLDRIEDKQSQQDEELKEISKTLRELNR